MKTRGKIVNLDLDYITHKPKLTIQLDSMNFVTSGEYDKLKELDDLDINVEKHKEIRGKDANSYLWVLCQGIADKLGSTKEEVYREMIHDKGPFSIVPVKDEIVDQYIYAWQHHGLGWVAEIFSKSKHEGYTNIIAYYGSSTFDKKQMSIFLEYVDQEAKKLGVPTLSDLEYKRMLEQYEMNYTN